MEEGAMPARFPRRKSLTVVGAAALVLGIANPVAAPPGDLDPTFDGDGRVTTDFGGIRDEAFGVAVQGDGKIVAVGCARCFSTSEDFALARYNTDGSLDTTFDGDGKVTTDFAGGEDAPRGVAIQADGRIVAAGYALVSGSIDFALARFNTDGSLDTTFSGDGKVTTAFAGTYDEARGVAIQTDGKIVAAGFTVTDFALARYNTDGSLDTTFDGDGRVTTDFAGDNELARDLAIQGDGRIVAAGVTRFAGIYYLALARYNTDGSLDTTFDGDGKVTTDFGGIGGGTTEAFAVAIQTNGRIVAAGDVLSFGEFDFAVARYNIDGSLDTTFSGDGKVTTDFAGDHDRAFAVAIQANGRIVAAGEAIVSGNYDFALARYMCVRRTSRPMSIPLCP
jgi:uncharacterized delta-60 repeat protein